MVEEDMRSVNSQSTEHLVYSMTPREDTPYTPYEVDRLKRHLKFHFMTPCQKFKARKRKPWKLIVQILKIIIVTTQVRTYNTDDEFFSYMLKVLEIIWLCVEYNKNTRHQVVCQ